MASASGCSAISARPLRRPLDCLRALGLRGFGATESHDEKLADALVEHQDAVRQVIGGISGFKGYHVLKLAEGTSTVSLFENAEGADESNRAAAAWLKENLPDMNLQPPYVTAGEVVLSF